jgi:hypothetical protein
LAYVNQSKALAAISRGSHYQHFCEENDKITGGKLVKYDEVGSLTPRTGLTSNDLSTAHE